MSNNLMFCFGLLVAARASEGLFFNPMSRMKPYCLNTTSDFHSISVDVRFTPRALLHPENDTFELFMEVEWTVVRGEGIPIDGFAVHFMEVAEKRNYSIPNYSIAPTSPCISGGDHIWLHTTDQQHACDSGSEVAECDDKFPEFCLCPVSNCSLLPNPLECRGTPDLLRDKKQFYRTVPSATTKLQYPIDFHVQYEFAIIPYYRHFANAGQQKTKKIVVDDCVGLLENLTESRDVANVLCCERGAKSIMAYNVTDREQRPHFGKFANETSINATLYWVLPQAESLDGFRVNLSPYEETEHNFSPEHTPVVETFIGGSSAETKSAACSAPLYAFQIEAYNLTPGQKYILMISPKFGNEDIARWCDQGRCLTDFSFVAKEPENLCLAKYGLCDARATCKREHDSATGRDVICKCRKGWMGDGLNAQIGGGCKNVDSCAPGNECSDFADCEDLPPPRLGVRCTCKDGYHGDGRLTGSGCTSKIGTALAVSLPIVAVLITITAVVIFCIVKRRRKARDKFTSQYIVDTNNGILASYTNTMACQEEDGSYEPTFGSEWEIDRRNICFGEVLGRGNYGIARKAWLSNGNERADSGNIARKSAKEDDNNKPDVDETVVAVKHLQESMRNHENLRAFLAEIGCMLNIGNHKNIARVYGCCTTKEPVYLVTEYLRYGDLLHFLWDAREPSSGNIDPIYKVTELSLCVMARHVAEGMTYLQQMRFIHGDIAARNILVGDDGICKLSDFGLANDVYKYSVIEGQKEKLVPLKWSSPERLMSGQVPITSKSDVWSYGNLVYEMFTLGCPPHPGVPSSELLDRLRSGYRMKQPNTCNDQIYGMMKKCWGWRAPSRPTFVQLIKMLDTAIGELHTIGTQVNIALAVEKLDREQYVDEFMATKPRSSENTDVNGTTTSPKMNDSARADQCGGGFQEIKDRSERSVVHRITSLSRTVYSISPDGFSPWDTGIIYTTREELI